MLTSNEVMLTGPLTARSKKTPAFAACRLPPVNDVVRGDCADETDAAPSIIAAASKTLQVRPFIASSPFWVFRQIDGPTTDRSVQSAWPALPDFPIPSGGGFNLQLTRTLRPIQAKRRFGKIRGDLTPPTGFLGR